VTSGGLPGFGLQSVPTATQPTSMAENFGWLTCASEGVAAAQMRPVRRPAATEYRDALPLSCDILSSLVQIRRNRFAPLRCLAFIRP
jgi:hypothetical protein